MADQPKSVSWLLPSNVRKSKLTRYLQTSVSFLNGIGSAEDFVERAQQAVSAVWQMTTRAREWVANVSDVLYPGSDPRMLDGGRAAVGLADLQKLLLESHSLPVRVAEADEVTRIIRAAVDWQHKADEALAALQTPTRTRSGRGSAMQLTTLRDMLHEAQLIPVRLDQRIEIKERVESE